MSRIPFAFLAVLIACSSGSNPKSISSMVTIKQARQLQIGSVVEVMGAVTVAPGTFSASLPVGLVIQDPTAGIYVLDSLSLGKIKVGEVVRLSGRVEESNGLLCIRTGKITRIDSLVFPLPKKVHTGSVNEITEGLLISVMGKVKRLENDLPYGYKIFIDDGSGLLNVFVNNSTGLIGDTTQWINADSLEVVGFSSEYNVSYEICPRMRDDIRIIHK